MNYYMNPIGKMDIHGKKFVIAEGNTVTITPISEQPGSGVSVTLLEPSGKTVTIPVFPIEKPKNK